MWIQSLSLLTNWLEFDLLKYWQMTLTQKNIDKWQSNNSQVSSLRGQWEISFMSMLRFDLASQKMCKTMLSHLHCHSYSLIWSQLCSSRIHFQMILQNCTTSSLRSMIIDHMHPKSNNLDYLREGEPWAEECGILILMVQSLVRSFIIEIPLAKFNN